ncbi:MAG: leucine-rich repeat domain-containing protein [Bacteroidales bacterium]|nr:leucine-rich repeat domain-containing protein [Bacteroidales bacterium]
MKKTLFFSILAMLITFAAKAQTQTRHVYVDENTDSHSHLATQIEADASGKVDITSLSEGWYYVESMTATLENELTIYGNVVLILGNRGNLTITGGINILAGSSLTIYDGTYYAAGAFQGGELIIQDEDMTVDGALIINSASLFKVNDNIIGSGSVRINNGKVEINSMGVYSDDVCFDDVSILGGQVEVNYIKADNLTLGYKTEKDQITISGCDVASASVADGCGYMLDGSLIQGALSDEQISKLPDVDLKQPTVPLPDGITDISEIANSITLKTNLPYTSEPQLLAEYDQIDIEYGKLVFFVADVYYNGDWADEPMATAIGTYTVSYKIESTSPIFKDSDSEELSGTASIVAKDGVTFTDNTIKYYIYDETKKYVEVIGWEDENYNAGSDIEIKIPATVSKDDVVYEVRKIRDNAFSRLEAQSTYGYLNKVTFATDNNIISIGDKAFYNNKLSSINLEACNNLTTIGKEAFGYCENLESIIIPDGVTELADQLFMTSGLLKSVTFSKVTKIGTGVFKETSLESVNLDGVTEIGGAAFNQSKIKNLAIPKSVKSIGGEAFESCKYLESITFAEGGALTTIEGSTFNGVGGENGVLLDVTVPSNITKIGDNAFANAAIKKITFEEGVTSFGNGVFAYISGMNVFSGLDIEIKAANPTLGDAPFGDDDFYVEQAKEKGSTLTISPCADRDAIKEAWGDYFDDDKIIGGFTLDETLLPDAFKKEYDGDNEILFESSEPIIGTGYSIALHSATLWDANNMPSPTVGKDKTVKINYDITVSDENTACSRTGATTQLSNSITGIITTTKEITIYPNSNKNITIEGVTSDPGAFTEKEGSTNISATYQNANQLINVQANAATAIGEYTLTSADGTVMIKATVPAPPLQASYTVNDEPQTVNFYNIKEAFEYTYPDGVEAITIKQVDDYNEEMTAATTINITKKFTLDLSSEGKDFDISYSSRQNLLKFQIQAGASLTINAPTTAKFEHVNFSVGGTLTIDGGDYTVVDEDYLIGAINDGTIVINDGNFVSKSDAGCISVYGEATISGGTFEVQESNGIPLTVRNGGTVELSGGTFKYLGDFDDVGAIYNETDNSLLADGYQFYQSGSPIEEKYQSSYLIDDSDNRVTNVSVEPKQYSITLPDADWEVIDENGNAIDNPTAPKGATIIIRYKGTKVVKEVKVETN